MWNQCFIPWIFSTIVPVASKASTDIQWRIKPVCRNTTKTIYLNYRSSVTLAGIIKALNLISVMIIWGWGSLELECVTAFIFGVVTVVVLVVPQNVEQLSALTFLPEYWKDKCLVQFACFWRLLVDFEAHHTWLGSTEVWDGNSLNFIMSHMPEKIRLPCHVSLLFIQFMLMINFFFWVLLFCDISDNWFFYLH